MSAITARSTPRYRSICYCLSVMQMRGGNLPDRTAVPELNRIRCPMRSKAKDSQHLEWHDPFNRSSSRLPYACLMLISRECA